MAGERVHSRLIQYGPYIFLGLGVVLASVVLFMGLGGELSAQVQRARQTISKHQSDNNANRFDEDATNNYMLAQLAKKKPLPQVEQIPLQGGNDIKSGIVVRLPSAMPGDTTVVDQNPTTTGPTTTTDPKEKPEALTLIEPFAVDAKHDLERMAIYVFWNERPRAKHEMEPSDIGFFVWRAEVDKDANPGQWKLLTTAPLVGVSRFADQSIDSAKEYLYAVAQVSRLDIKVPEKPEELVGYKMSAKTTDDMPVSLTVPTDVEWFFEDMPLSGVPILDVRLRRWELAPTLKGEGDNPQISQKWMRFTLIVREIPVGGPIGEKYKFSHVLSGSVGFDNLKCDFSVEEVVDDKFQEVDQESVKKRFKSMMLEKVDFDTGKEFLGGQKTGSVVFRGGETVKYADKKWNENKMPAKVPEPKLADPPEPVDDDK